MEETMSKLAVRALRSSERAVLEQKLADKTLSAYVLDRYRMIQAVAEGFSPTEVAQILQCERITIYQWVKRFNAEGFAQFEKATNPNGRPALLRAEHLRQLVKIALSRPHDLGLPYTTWSVAKLAEYCRARKLLPDVSNEWVRRLLRREGLSLQRTKTWKESPDPEFEKKKPYSQAVS